MASAELLPADPAGTGRPAAPAPPPCSSSTSSRSSSAGRSVSSVAPSLAPSRPRAVASNVSVDGQHHVPEHRDEAAVAVPGEALVPGLLRQPLHRLIVQAEVEDGVHHARHRTRAPRADRDQERVARGRRAACRRRPRAGQMRRATCGHSAGGMLLAGRVVGGPGLGGDGEAGRNRDADLGHLGQLAALAAQQRPQGARAFRLAVRERVDVLGRSRRKRLRQSGARRVALFRLPACAITGTP